MAPFIALLLLSKLALTAPVLDQHSPPTCFSGVSEPMRGSTIETAQQPRALLNPNQKQSFGIPFIGFSDLVESTSIDSPGFAIASKPSSEIQHLAASILNPATRRRLRNKNERN